MQFTYKFGKTTPNLKMRSGLAFCLYDPLAISLQSKVRYAGILRGIQFCDMQRSKT
jgi:hypothetical protein